MFNKEKGRNIIQLITSILVCQVAGIIGSIFTFPSIPTWYATLNKPAFSPPNFIFGPVWTILYTLMGISLYMVWKKRRKIKAANGVFALFGFHLFLNSLWSILFFGLKNPGLAFFEIIILLITLIAVMIKFYAIDKKAAIILLPYLFWIGFASLLNFSVWTLNP